jgi:hypothetical protein
MNGDEYIRVENWNGEGYICPLGALTNPVDETRPNFGECVEEEVPGRYAGNLNIIQ